MSMAVLDKSRLQNLEDICDNLPPTFDEDDDFDGDDDSDTMTLFLSEFYLPTSYSSEKFQRAAYDEYSINLDEVPPFYGTFVLSAIEPIGENFRREGWYTDVFECLSFGDCYFGEKIDCYARFDERKIGGQWHMLAYELTQAETFEEAADHYGENVTDLLRANILSFRENRSSYSAKPIPKISMPVDEFCEMFPWVYAGSKGKNISRFELYGAISEMFALKDRVDEVKVLTQWDANNLYEIQKRLKEKR